MPSFPHNADVAAGRRVLLVVAVAGALVVAVAGCSADAPAVTETPLPMPTLVETPTATPTPVAAPQVTTCDDLVSAADQQKYEAEGWGLSDDFVQRMTAGYTLDQHNGADRYTHVTDDVYFSIYLFTGDHWFYGSSASAADRARQTADVG